MDMDLHAVRRRAVSLFAGFTTGQKAMLGIAVLAVVVGGWLFTSWAATPTLSPLYTGLDPADASAVTEELTSRGIAYQLEDAGRSVMVPQEAVYQLRLDLSAQGLPAGGQSGYALLDEQGITTSEFRQRVDYQRALEGELSKTIGAIDGVDAVTVHLVIPEDDLFGQDDTHPSASVLVRTRRGQDLDAGQVQAVVHLVASSVEGLVPGEVTVADSTGRVLSAPGADGASVAAGDARSGQVAAFEQKLASSVEDMLGTVVGPGHAVVRVSADLDFDERNTTIERFETPEAGAPAVTESTTEETYTGTGGGATGVLGVDGTPIPGAEEQPTDYTKADAERTFAVGKVTEQVKSAPGAVRRLSVAVLLDGTVDAAANQADIERLVSAAAGLDPARDTIQVGRMPFDTAAAEAAQTELAEAEAAAQRSEMIDLARTVAVVAIVALVLLLLARNVRKASRRAPVVEPVLTAELAAARAAEPAADARGAGAQLVLAGAGAAPALPAGAEERRAVVTNHIGSLIDQQPDEVAQLLRGWLGDRRS